MPATNIAGLLLARGLMRRPEAAIRVALGAGFGRLARLFFTESLLLASVGCVLGLVLAYTGLDVLKAVLPDDAPRLTDAAIDGRVILCGVGLAFVAALFFGGLPAWQFAASAQMAAIKEKSKTPVRSVLVIAEVALSLMLLVVAGLLANSFLRLSRQAAGFNPAQAYSFTVMFPWDSKSAPLNSFSGEALDRLSAFPGSVAAGVVDRLPLHGGSQSSYIVVRGRELPVSLADTEVGWRTASSGYFAAAGVPLLSGSIFRDRHEALVSQRLAAALFPGDSPVGHEIAERSRGDASQPEWFRITGVIGEVQVQPTDPVPPMEIYVPWGSTFWPVMNFVVRTDRPLSDVASFVREQIQPLSKEQVFEKVESLGDLTAETRSAPRIRAILMGSFSAVSLALAAIGLFGLMAQEVARRTQDFGVRMALGAEPQRIAIDSLTSGLRLALAGLVVGLIGSLWISRLLTSLLFGVEPRDVLTYAAASLVLLATVALAALIPALRASRIDPIRALRHE